MGPLRNRQAIVNALRSHPTADLYEHGDERGKGSGRFGLSNPAPQIATLDRDDVAILLRDKVIRRKWAECDGCFVLTETAKGARP